MNERTWAVDYQIFPDDLDPLGNPKGACFAYDGKGNELDCAEIESRLNEYETLERNIASLLRHGSFMDYKGRCEQYLHCRLCDEKWLWENDEPSEHKEDCLYLLKADILEGK